MARPVLEVRALWVGDGPDAACRGVSLAVQPGQVVAVLGAEGAGKSQLLRCIGLDFPPASGTVLLHGVDVTGSSGDRRRELRARAIELVHPPAPPGSDDATVPSARAGVLLGAARPATVPVAGMRQRIQIARAITRGTDVLLLDEPFTDVEAHVRGRILELLGRVRDETATGVIVATRDPRVARLLADRVVLLVAGEVVADGPTDVVLDAHGDPRRQPQRGVRRSA